MIYGRIKLLAATLAALAVCYSPALASQDGGADEKLIALIRNYQNSIQIALGAWPDVSSAGLQNLETHDQTTQAQLRTIPRNELRPDNRTLYDLLAWQIDGRLEQLHARLYLTPFWQDRRLFPEMGLLGALDPLWSLRAPATLSDYEERIRKFASFPEYVKQVLALLHEANTARMLPAHELAWQATSAAGRWLSDPPGMLPSPFAANTTVTPAERTLFAPFESMQGIDTEDRIRLQEAARQVIRERVVPAVREYYDALAHQYLPACPESPSLTQWPNGFEVYRVLLKRATTGNLDPKQVQDFGLKEVKRIRNEMAALVTQTDFKDSLDKFLVHARTDPEFYFSNDQDLLAAYRSAIQEIEPLLPKVLHNVPKLTIRVEPVPVGTAAWYEAPSAKHSYHLVNVGVGTLDIHPRFEVIPIMLHEGLPGHALQHAVARGFEPRTPDAITAFQLEARQSTGFGEGWGLYSETLGYNLGLYRTPMDKFGALRMRLTRAVRIAVDTGVHLSGWTLRQAKDYAAANTGEPESQIELEVGRTVWPGGQPAYTIGEQQIEAMRDMAAKRLGEKFDLPAFHDTVLAWGPLPLEVMRHKVAECLADQRCSPTFQTSAR